MAAYVRTAVEPSKAKLTPIIKVLYMLLQTLWLLVDAVGGANKVGKPEVLRN